MFIRQCVGDDLAQLMFAFFGDRLYQVLSDDILFLSRKESEYDHERPAVSMRAKIQQLPVSNADNIAPGKVCGIFY